MRLAIGLGVVLLGVCGSLFAAEKAPDYELAVAPILQKYCAGCHNPDDHEGQFSVESFDELQKGGEHGAAVLAGDPGTSRLIRMVTGATKPKMPPEDEPQPTAEEIAVLKAWVEAGAKGPAGKEPDRTKLTVPMIAAKPGLADPVTALDWSSDGQWIASARFSGVELQSATNDRKPVVTWVGLPGKVTALHFVDGNRFVTASGVPGLYGQVNLWHITQDKPTFDFRGHRDVLYDAELSPNGELIATCSYDKKIVLWNAKTAEQVRVLEGHTGPVYDIAFSPDGKNLVSASADDTCKVWLVATGERLDTLFQPLKEVYSVAFNPAGDQIAAVGADSRIRVWKFLSRDTAIINPQIIARFAHEAPVTQLRYSPDGRYVITCAEDRTVKLWDAKTMSEIKEYGQQSDVVQSLAFSPDGSRFAVGRVDGTIEILATMPVPTSASGEAPLVSAPMAAATAPMMETAETEPNNIPAEATAITIPATLKGAIQGKPNGQPDSDLYKFTAQAGQEWVIEVNAARSKSPLDSIIDVLDINGQPVERVILQATRDSYFTFRGKNGDDVSDFRVFNWEEMELNEYLYSNGEVVKLWLAPRGPDSGFTTYPGEGNRHGYFDTTPVTHALGEPCYIVEPHAPGTEIVPNGLPVFRLNYQNDDSAKRDLGADSKLTFTAPRDGEYLVRIRDVRGYESDKHTYQLVIRPRRPDFAVTLQTKDPTVNIGSAKEFRLTVSRQDDYAGPVRIDLTGLPPGYTATTPLTIQAGQNDTFGVLTAAADAPVLTPENAKASKLTATATINGQEVTHDVNNFGEIKRAEAAKVTLKIVAADNGAQLVVPADGSPAQVDIEPGQTIMLKVVVDRKGYDGNVPFGNEGSGRNLPHGLIVDNIGLNGLLILEKQTERHFFISAAKWVPDQERLFHLKTDVEGGQAAAPVLIRVKRSGAVVSQ